MLLIVMFVFISVFSLTLWMGYNRMVAEDKIQNRIRNISGHVEINHTVIENRGTLLGRMATFISNSILKIAGRFVPEKMNSKLSQRLFLAGLSAEIGWREWRLLSILICLVLPVMVGQAMIIAGTSMGHALIRGLLISLMFQIMLRYYLVLRIRKRRERIVSELPDILDLITVSVEAGLSFDGAIDRVATEVQGPLADEFAITLKELRMGKTRRDALRKMSDRCLVADLTTLVGSIIQADELGVAIGKILRIQSEQMRDKRKQRAREKSMKAPVKLLFPLLLFIFPSVLIVLIGPALIKLSQMF